MPLLAFDYLGHSVTLSSIRYTKHCIDGQPSEHSLWHTRDVVWYCLADRRWQQCRKQNMLALLLMTSEITRYRMWYSVSGCGVNLTYKYLGQLKLQ